MNISGTYTSVLKENDQSVIFISVITFGPKHNKGLIYYEMI